MRRLLLRLLYEWVKMSVKLLFKTLVLGEKNLRKKEALLKRINEFEKITAKLALEKNSSELHGIRKSLEEMKKQLS